jgi:hypothetical protein
VDFDFDGDPDFSAGALLFRNDGGKFVEVSKALGLKTTGPESRFVDWFDYDNDGSLDFLKLVPGVSSAITSMNELWIYKNGRFVNVSGETGITATTQSSQAAFNIGDYDNDGDQDIFLQSNSPDRIEGLLLNDEIEPGVRAFADIGDLAGLKVTTDKKGSTNLDYDMDGFLDIFVASAEKGAILYRNVTNSNHWVGFNLEGTRSNRDAIGTLITVVTGSKRQIRYTKAPTSWKVQDNPFVHFGLGTATRIDSVVIRWTLGQRQVLTGVAIDKYHNVKEPGASGIGGQLGNGIPLACELEQNYPNPFNPTTVIRYQLPTESNVRLVVYDVLGREVNELVNERKTTGVYQVAWDGKDRENRSVGAGVYFYRIEAGSYMMMKKMILLR